ncbi:uncharacterized protein C14orf80 homolog [Anoplophora glabripennis]|uniref:uncharacterized protein C14orf80 homolog n=1 Tax=Anoplophora glabripennis TaxID=217634 RepID=UPI000874197E|nr:uncharacterized protein C14orf80 homolog [Anoplophora glabripennis]
MSVEIKSVIGLLCKQLNIILNVNLIPEYFRLAKFDKNEDNVIPVLWSTLNLLTTKQSQTKVEEIKDHMKSLNYSSTLFYILPGDFSSGSRELLLAIAFIIAKDLSNLINEEIKQSPFDDSFSLIDLEDVAIQKPEVPNMMGDTDMKNYIMWLKGRTRQNKKMTKEYETQITKIYEKLNSLLNNKSNGKLLLNEVLALSSKKYCKEFLEKCSRIMDLLECYQEWNRKQKIFWKWMASVLYERETEYLCL